ncbi:hypothetical protein [Streptomyces bluensis]
MGGGVGALSWGPRRGLPRTAGDHSHNVATAAPHALSNLLHTLKAGNLSR